MKKITSAAFAAVALVSAPSVFAQTTNAVGPIKDVNSSTYTQKVNVSGNTETASATEAANKQTFKLSGTVNQDCSFYDGGSANHNVALNTIGVRTGNNENVSQAFNQVADLTVTLNTATAGCNTKNKVTVKSANAGKLLNGKAVGFDSAEFTDSIPYNFKADWQGVGASGKGQKASPQKIEWTTTSGASSVAPVTGGAWRSAFNIAITAPAQAKGLVAGDYEDTIEVTLAAEA